MRIRGLRGPMALTFVRCLWVAAPATLLAALAGLAMSALLAPPVDGLDQASGAETPWLHLPLFVAALACAGAAAAFWPVFAARRPGAAWIERLQRGPLRGNGAAIAGALCAQAMLTIPITTVLAIGLGAPRGAVAHVALDPPADPLIARTGQRLRFAAPEATSAIELQLRPLAAPPDGPLRASRLRVLADDQPLDDAGFTFEQSGQLVRLPFPARAIRVVEIERIEGNVPLLFLRGSVVLVGAGTHSTLWNGIRAALVYLLPTLVALAVGCLCGARAALPTVLTAVGGLLFVLTLGGAGPADDALRSLMRGLWLAAGPTFSACVPSLAAGSVAMILAMLLQKRPPR